jgi:hypothetical protein
MDDLFEHNKPDSNTAMAMLEKVKRRYRIESELAQALGYFQAIFRKIGVDKNSFHRPISYTKRGCILYSLLAWQIPRLPLP